MAKVKRHERRPGTRISSKHQVTIPVTVLREAGLQPGDRLTVRVEGGRVVLEREDDLIEEYAGIFTGAYETGELDRMRAEWR